MGIGRRSGKENDIEDPELAKYIKDKFPIEVLENEGGPVLDVPEVSPGIPSTVHKEKKLKRRMRKEQGDEEQ